MSTLKRRLNSLWKRQTSVSEAPRPLPARFADRMVVTISEPMKLSGTVLLPGKYAFRMLDPGSEHNLVQIFNEDQTTLMATLTTMSEN